MTGLLRGCRAKIERADECVKNLNVEINAFLSSDPPPYAVFKKLQDNARQYVFLAKSHKAVPDRFAVLAGEIVHHLASSLDHLFAALVTKNGNMVEKRHYFPIYTSTKKFRKACDRGAISDVSATAQKLISSVQPCKTPAPRDTILAAVKEINNIDKHRLLIVIVVAGNLSQTVHIGCKGKDIRDIHGNPANIVSLGDPALVAVNEKGVEFFRIGLAEPTPEFEADTDFSAQIVFAQCGLAKLVPLTQALPSMIAGVTHTINLFVGEFDSDD